MGGESRRGQFGTLPLAKGIGWRPLPGFGSLQIDQVVPDAQQPVEEARAFAALMELNGWNGKQVAARLRVPASQVSRALVLLRLPDDIRQRVDSGEIAARAGYELSKLENADHQRQLAERAANGNLTHEETARLVRQHRGKRRRQHRISPCHTRLCFPTEQGWEVIVSAPRKGTYAEIEQALEEALAKSATAARLATTSCSAAWAV